MSVSIATATTFLLELILSAAFFLIYSVHELLLIFVWDIYTSIN